MQRALKIKPLTMSVAVTCLTSTTLTLTAISCDRFMAVMYPLRVVSNAQLAWTFSSICDLCPDILKWSSLHQTIKRITQSRARTVIIAIWTTAIIVAIPFVVFRKLFEIHVSFSFQSKLVIAISPISIHILYGRLRILSRPYVYIRSSGSMQ